MIHLIVILHMVSSLEVFWSTFCLFLISQVHATCPAYLILLDLITLRMLGKENKLWISLICNFLHNTSSLWGPNILFRT
jgi:hypothetical protein